MCQLITPLINRYAALVCNHLNCHPGNRRRCQTYFRQSNLVDSRSKSLHASLQGSRIESHLHSPILNRRCNRLICQDRSHRNNHRFIHLVLHPYNQIASQLFSQAKNPPKGHRFNQLIHLLLNRLEYRAISRSMYQVIRHRNSLKENHLFNPFRDQPLFHQVSLAPFHRNLPLNLQSNLHISLSDFLPVNRPSNLLEVPICTLLRNRQCNHFVHHLFSRFVCLPFSHILDRLPFQQNNRFNYLLCNLQ